MKISEIKNKFYFNTIIIILIFLLDRVTKLIVINLSKNNISQELFSSKYLNIQLIWNEGIAFGLFSFQKEILYNFLTVLILLIIFIIFFVLIKSQGLKKYCYLMIFGGAIGNVYDRLFYKAVPDFIDLHVENFHWFIFNIADIFITVGIIFLIFLEYTDINNEKNL